jgi:hypothetical protein
VSYCSRTTARHKGPTPATCQNRTRRCAPDSANRAPHLHHHSLPRETIPRPSPRRPPAAPAPPPRPTAASGSTAAHGATVTADLCCKGAGGDVRMMSDYGWHQRVKATSPDHLRPQPSAASRSSRFPGRTTNPLHYTQASLALVTTSGCQCASADQSEPSRRAA